MINLNNIMKRFICLIYILAFSSCSGADVQKNIVLSQNTKDIQVDYVGTQKTIIINEDKIISKLTNLLNGVEYEIISDKDEQALKLSSVGGLKITPDGKNDYYFYITSCFGKEIIEFSKVLQTNLKLKKAICYIPDSTSKEIDKLFY